MKRKLVKRRVYEFTNQELDVLTEALAKAAAATRGDIAALDGANAETLEPHIAAWVRFTTLQRRIFRGR